MFFLRTPSGVMPMDKVRVKWSIQEKKSATAVVYLEEWRGDHWAVTGWHSTCPTAYVDKFFDDLEFEINRRERGCIDLMDLWDPPSEESE